MKAPQWREEAGGTSFGIFALISRPSMSFLFSPASSSASAIASAAKSTAHRPANLAYWGNALANDGAFWQIRHEFSRLTGRLFHTPRRIQPNH